MNGTEALSSRRWRRGLIEIEERVGAIDAKTGSEPPGALPASAYPGSSMPVQI